MLKLCTQTVYIIRVFKIPNFKRLLKFFKSVIRDYKNLTPQYRSFRNENNYNYKKDESS